MPTLEPPYTLIRDALRESRVIPFLGAGASLGARDQIAARADAFTALPSASELAQYLADKTEFPAGEPLDLAKVAEYYDVVGGRDPLHRELHKIFNRDFPITPLHTFLADVAASTPLLIVTTNYDDLIERALAAKNCAYDCVIYTTNPTIGERVLWWQPGAAEPEQINPNKLDLHLEKNSIVYKMHGTVDRRDAERDQYVITEDDYVDFLVRMTKNKAIPAIFAEAFQTRHFLFLGYGLRDWNLRVVLNRIEKDLRRPKNIKSWAIQKDPSPLEKRFWQNRGVEVYDLTIQDFVAQLAYR